MKKEYEKPEVCVVKLEHQGCLLEASKPGYDPVSWGREMDDLSIDDLSGTDFLIEEGK